MDSDAHAVRIQVTKMHDGSVGDLIEKQPNCRCVPTRNMSDEPVIGWTQVEIWTEVLHKEHRPRMPTG
jgi:hypothetical protein